MARLLTISLVLAALLGGCGTVRKDITIPRAKIQEMVDEKFPYDRNVLVARLTLDTPEIYFKDDNIGMKLAYYGNFLDKEVRGTVDFNGHITYKPEEGAFYLSEFDVVDIAVNEANISSHDQLKATILKILNNYLDGFPVYTLDPADFKQNLAKLLLRDVRIEGENLIVTLGP